jgi:hypothetical protein
MKSKKSAPFRYKGLLNQPIESDLSAPHYANKLMFNVEEAERSKLQYEDYVREQVASRLRLLRHAHGLPGDASWEALARALASAHVPGFRIEPARKKGRPREWTGSRIIMLVRAVDQLVIGNRPLSEAFRKVAAQEQWAPLGGYPQSMDERKKAIVRRSNALKAIYYEGGGKKPAPQI